jgi:hypothetical protein
MILRVVVDVKPMDDGEKAVERSAAAEAEARMEAED